MTACSFSYTYCQHLMSLTLSMTHLHTITKYIPHRLHGHYFSRTFSTNTSATESATARGWRKYAHRFRDKPASHLISFAILHEITAVLPLPFVYYFLKYTELKVPIPEEAVVEANRIVSKVRTRYGFSVLEPNNRVMVNLATSYALVKIAMPLRIGVSLWATPFFAEKVISPVLSLYKRIPAFKKSLTSGH